MKVILRNLQPTLPLNIDFTGFDVTPISVSVQPLKSQTIETGMPLLELRKISGVATALGAGFLSISAQGGLQVLN